MGARAVVVGGSIAGCGAAIALGHAGYQVTVYERSAGALEERGFGIAIPPALHEELISVGYLDAAMPARPMSTRVWVARESTRRDGRELWRQSSSAVACNWGLLWAALRAQVPAGSYVAGRGVTAVGGRDGGAVVELDGNGEGGGEEQRADLVVGADGYRSTARALVDPQAKPRYAGYALWRASFPTDLASGHPHPVELLADSFVTVVFDGGHAVFYLIPARQPPAGPGGNLLNVGIYARPPAGAVGDDVSLSYPPGAVTDRLVAHVRRLADEHFPPSWAEVANLADDASYGVQPVYDLPLARYRAGSVVLAGDAGTITRPHTASGATKALQDALGLEAHLRRSSDRDGALAAYDRERTAEGNRLVELGRRLGHAQIEATPDWTTMGPAEMEAWTARTLAGQHHYLYDGGEDPPPPP
jgi:2-polyprenyl-6-methoxyphenol hydroxylase-like FAD-dependent oxidoreductase